MYEQGTLLKLTVRSEKYPLFVMVTKGKTSLDKFNGVVIHDEAEKCAYEHHKPGAVMQNATGALFTPVEWVEVVKFIFNVVEPLPPCITCENNKEHNTQIPCNKKFTDKLGRELFFMSLCKYS